MKYSILVTISVLAVSSIFSGCDGDQPGSQAGYAGDGSNDCSQSLVFDYDQIADAQNNIKSMVDQLDPSDSAAGQAEIQTIQSEIDSANAEISAFRSNYGAVSCTALDQSDGSNITVDESNLDTLASDLSTDQQLINVLNQPVSGVADCSSAGMFTDNLAISKDITLAQNSVQAAEANVDPTQKSQGLEAAQAQLQTASALLTTYNNEYAGAYCALNGVGVLTSSSLSGPEGTQISQLEQRIATDLAAL